MVSTPKNKKESVVKNSESTSTKFALLFEKKYVSSDSKKIWDDEVEHHKQPSKCDLPFHQLLTDENTQRAMKLIALLD